jgi:hypothetical protein
LPDGGALPQVLWTSNTSGSDGFSSPAIGSDGTLFIGSSDGSLHAIVATGGRGQAQYILVSRWTNESSVSMYTLDDAGVLHLLRTTSAAGVSLEDLLVVDRSQHDERGGVYLLAASNPCDYRDPVSKVCVDRMRDPKICSIASLELSRGVRDDTRRTPDEEGPTLTRLSNVWSGGLGPTAIALHPSGHSVAVANYQSGMASILPLDGSGVLSSVTATTSILSDTSSLAHDVAYDRRCGEEAALLLVNAGALEMATFNPSSGQLEHAVSTRIRTRHVVIHEAQDVVYALYELDGSVGVWPWTARHKRGAGDSCGRLGSAEIARVPSAPRSELCANSSALSEWQVRSRPREWLRL